ncbi:unnamed protein product [Prorocentrum cordatum]|uniref:PARP n=1 Tax=Prorocentrum cordatum TaxID=2364126 RepID=A0ABN9TRY4_9DINO|nr:unnamed protein product [Polarella glacialis]
MPAGTCALCSSVKYKNQYALGQWSRDDGRRVCKVCLEGKKSIGTPWQYADAFVDFQWEKAGNARCKGGMCLECEELKKHLQCSRCGEQKLLDQFAKAETIVNEEPTCKACIKLQREQEKARPAEAKRVVCSQCGESKSKAEFSAHTLCNVSKASIACTQCVDAAAAQRDTAARKDGKACVVCEVVQRRECFSEWMWGGVADRDRKCKRCVAGAKLPRGWWRCIACKDAFERRDFSSWLAKRTTKGPDGKQRCNKCFADEERKRQEVAERSRVSVTKRQDDLGDTQYDGPQPRAAKASQDRLIFYGFSDGSVRVELPDDWLSCSSEILKKVVQHDLFFMWDSTFMLPIDEAIRWKLEIKLKTSWGPHLFAHLIACGSDYGDPCDIYSQIKKEAYIVMKQRGCLTGSRLYDYLSDVMVLQQKETSIFEAELEPAKEPTDEKQVRLSSWTLLTKNHLASYDGLAKFAEVENTSLYLIKNQLTNGHRLGQLIHHRLHYRKFLNHLLTLTMTYLCQQHLQDIHLLHRRLRQHCAKTMETTSTIGRIYDTAFTASAFSCSANGLKCSKTARTTSECRIIDDTYHNGETDTDISARSYKSCDCKGHYATPYTLEDSCTYMGTCSEASTQNTNIHMINQNNQDQVSRVNDLIEIVFDFIRASFAATWRSTRYRNVDSKNRIVSDKSASRVRARAHNIPIPFECTDADSIFDKVKQHMRFVEREAGVRASPSTSATVPTISLYASDKVSDSCFEEAVRMLEDIFEYARDHDSEGDDDEGDESELCEEERTHESEQENLESALGLVRTDREVLGGEDEFSEFDNHLNDILCGPAGLAALLCLLARARAAPLVARGAEGPPACAGGLVQRAPIVFSCGGSGGGHRALFLAAAGGAHKAFDVPAGVSELVLSMAPEVGPPSGAPAAASGDVRLMIYDKASGSYLVRYDTGRVSDRERSEVLGDGLVVEYSGSGGPAEEVRLRGVSTRELQARVLNRGVYPVTVVFNYSFGSVGSASGVLGPLFAFTPGFGPFALAWGWCLVGVLCRLLVGLQFEQIAHRAASLASGWARLARSGPTRLPGGFDAARDERCALGGPAGAADRARPRRWGRQAARSKRAHGGARRAPGARPGGPARAVAGSSAWQPCSGGRARGGARGAPGARPGGPARAVAGSSAWHPGGGRARGGARGAPGARPGGPARAVAGNSAWQPNGGRARGGARGATGAQADQLLSPRALAARGGRILPLEVTPPGRLPAAALAARRRRHWARLRARRGRCGSRRPRGRPSRSRSLGGAAGAAGRAAAAAAGGGARVLGPERRGPESPQPAAKPAGDAAGAAGRAAAAAAALHCVEMGGASKEKPRLYRTCQLGDEAMVDLVKQRVSLIEKNYINGTTEQIIKDNMPFLLDACQASQRLSSTALTKAIVSQKTHLTAEEAKRWATEMSRCVSYVVNKFRSAVAAEKLDHYTRTLGQAMNLECGRTSSGKKKETPRSDDVVESTSADDTRAESSAPAASAPRSPADARHKLIKELYGISPPPKAKTKKVTWYDWNSDPPSMVVADESGQETRMPLSAGEMGFLISRAPGGDKIETDQSNALLVAHAEWRKKREAQEKEVSKEELLDIGRQVCEQLKEGTIAET